MNWLHRLLNPHCNKCEELDLIDPVVEELKTELARLRYENDRLLNHILNKPPEQTVTSVERDADEIEPIKPKVVPWHVRRQMLEQEDREKARLLRQQKVEQDKAISELEKNLGVVTDTVLDLSEEGKEDVQSESKQVNE